MELLLGVRSSAWDLLDMISSFEYCRIQPMQDCDPTNLIVLRNLPGIDLIRGYISANIPAEFSCDDEQY